MIIIFWMKKYSDEMLNALLSNLELKSTCIWFDLNCSEAENPPIKWRTVIEDWKNIDWQRCSFESTIVIN